MQSGCNIMDFLQERPPFVRKSIKFTVKVGFKRSIRLKKKEINP